MASERSLRIITSFTTALSTPLLIACTVVTFKKSHSYYRWGMRERTATSFGLAFIPLGLTAFASLIGLSYYRKHGRMPDFRFALLDIAAAIMYLAILLPIWIVSTSDLRSPNLGLLAGYATAPMIMNMVIHSYLFSRNAMPLCSWIFSKTEHECPNCRSKFIISTPQAQETTSDKGERYSLLRGEDYLDEDAVPYTGERPSEDQVDVAGDADVDDKGKGAIKL